MKYIFSEIIFKIKKMLPSNFEQISKESNNTFESELEENVCFYEYSSAANPKLSQVPIRSYDSNDLEYKMTHIYDLNLQNDLNVNYKATTPNLLVSFIKIIANDEMNLNQICSSQLFYFLNGKGKCNVSGKGLITYYQGDMIVLGNEKVTFRSDKDTVIFWVSDYPLMKYLNVTSTESKFKNLLIRADKMFSNINNVFNTNILKERNRLGILLGNKDTRLSTLTLTPILWSLLNIIPENTTQKPHRHNSVAIDLCIYAPSTGIYTLMGSELDDFGNIKNPVKCEWKSGSVFITPPGWWHSHHNDTNDIGWVLPIQDAGLHTYMRTLDIQFIN